MSSEVMHVLLSRLGQYVRQDPQVVCPAERTCLVTSRVYKIAHLVLHKTDERGDDHAGLVGDHGRHLVAERLATARGLHSTAISR